MTIKFTAKDPDIAEFYQNEFGEKFAKELADLRASWDLRMKQVAQRKQHFVVTPSPGQAGKLLVPEIKVS
jgi:ABC-type Zn uptake system ZnuABC Zn-binding protein ZnuA